MESLWNALQRANPSPERAAAAVLDCVQAALEETLPPTQQRLVRATSLQAGVVTVRVRHSAVLGSIHIYQSEIIQKANKIIVARYPNHPTQIQSIQTKLDALLDYDGE